MKILGLSCVHDTSACLLVDGEMVADVAEERFSRIKHDASFPYQAITYCLEAGGLQAEELDVVAIGGRYLPLGLERYFGLSLAQHTSLAAMRPVESKARQLMLNSSPMELPVYMQRFELSPQCRFIGVEHHLSHAAAAYFTSGQRDPSLVLTLDGIGDNVAAAVWVGQGNTLEPLVRWGREASLGWFYSNVTEALGWQQGDGEGVTMGLAAYGDADQVGEALTPFHPIFTDGELTRPHSFGQASSINIRGNYHWHFADATAIRRLTDTLGPEHIAAAAQAIVEMQVLELVRHWTQRTGLRRLTCAGGLFLNVKLNQRLVRETGLDELWVYPNPGDAGLAAGAALWVWHDLAQPTRTWRLKHLYYGPEYADAEICRLLEERGLAYQVVANPAQVAAEYLAANRIVGWLQGRMEAGPRALGNRSILMSASRSENKGILNARVKFRQSFRPFCPALLHEHRHTYLKHGEEAPFMIIADHATTASQQRVPAVVHADGTLRPQTVKRETNPLFHDLIQAFGDLTGEYLLLSTSFNIKDEPIVCHPREAIRCFYDTGLDILIMGHYLLEKPML